MRLPNCGPRWQISHSFAIRQSLLQYEMFSVAQETLRRPFQAAASAAIPKMFSYNDDAGSCASTTAARADRIGWNRHSGADMEAFVGVAFFCNDTPGSIETVLKNRYTQWSQQRCGRTR